MVECTLLVGNCVAFCRVRLSSSFGCSGLQVRNNWTSAAYLRKEGRLFRDCLSSSGSRSVMSYCEP